MDVVTTLIDWVVNTLDTILPKLNLNSSFLNTLDRSISFFIDIIQFVGYFFPIDVFCICLATMLIIDNFALFMRIGQWIIRLVRG